MWRGNIKPITIIVIKSHILSHIERDKYNLQVFPSLENHSTVNNFNVAQELIIILKEEVNKISRNLKDPIDAMLLKLSKAE